MSAAALPIPDDEAYVLHVVTASTTGPFAVPFPLPLDYASALHVAIDGVELDNDDFTFAPDASVAGGYPTGLLTLATAVANADVEIWRDIPITRTSDYAPGPLDLDAINTELARLTMQVQDARLRSQRGELWTGGMGDVPIAAAMVPVVQGATLQAAREAFQVLRGITPEMLGAVADGAFTDNVATGTNNLTALQSAMTLAAAAGVPLDLGCNPTRQFNFAGQLDIPDNLVMRGKATLFHTGAAVALNIAGSRSIVLNDFILRSAARKAITNVTKANPGVMEIKAHGYGAPGATKIIVPSEIEGMVSLNNVLITATVVDADHVSIGINTTAYPDYDGGGYAIAYAAGHYGIYGQQATWVAGALTSRTWIEGIDLSGLEIDGFGEANLRLGFARDVKAKTLTLRRGGLHGFLLLSTIGGKFGDVESHDIGPGTGGTAYPGAISRPYSVSGVGQDLDDSPRSSDIHFNYYYAKNSPYYVGFDSHGGEHLSFDHIRTENCHIGANFEHATGDPGLPVPPIDILVNSFDMGGADPARFDIGPAFAVDGQSGASEVQQGIRVNGGVIRGHGHRDTFGNAVFGNGGVFRVNDTDAFIVTNVECYDCYGSIFYTGANGRIQASNWSSKGLIDVSGVRDVIKVASSSALVSIGGANQIDGAGYAVQTSWDNVILGGELALLNSAELANTTTWGVLRRGDFLCSWRGVGGTAVAASVTGTTNETVLATLTLPKLGPHSSMRITDIVTSHTNNANAKTLRGRLGGLSGTALNAIGLASLAGWRGEWAWKNRNNVASQSGGPSITASYGGGTPNTAAINTNTSAQAYVITAELAVDTDTVTLERFDMELRLG